MKYRISRQETTSANTFIRIDTDKPVYIERFIPTDEDVKSAVEKMVAELEISYDAYIAPEVAVSKTDEERATLETSLRPEEISKEKVRILEERENEEGETAVDTLETQIDAVNIN